MGTEAAEPTLWTIGHSNRSAEDFLRLLKTHQIQAIADVRRFPGSRRHPHFGAEELARQLAEEGIDYRHFADLGGRRGRSSEDSPNTAWRVESFNAYADYMATSEFKQALRDLIEWAEQRRVAVMCSEAVPWRCHRRLISDAVLIQGGTVLDITGLSSPKPHRLTDFAQVHNGQLIYKNAKP